MSHDHKTPFGDRLTAAIKAKGSPLVVGLDPNIDLIAPEFTSAYKTVAEPSPSQRQDFELKIIEEYFMMVLDQIHPHAVAVKPQLAYFEVFGSKGIAVLERLNARAREWGLMIIADGKRGDIGSTAEAYAKAYLGDGPLSADALTVNPFLGADALEPLVTAAREHHRGLFVLLHTSNPSGRTLQRFSNGSVEVADRVIEMVADDIAASVGDSGFSPIGFVVGATNPELFAQVRSKLPHSYFLIPGIGAQGGDAADLKLARSSSGPGSAGGGIAVASSRAITYPQRYGQKPAFTPAAIAAAAEEARRLCSA